MARAACRSGFGVVAFLGAENFLGAGFGGVIFFGTAFFTCRQMLTAQAAAGLQCRLFEGPVRMVARTAKALDATTSWQDLASSQSVIESLSKVNL